MIVGKLLENAHKPNYGYDAQKGEYCDMIAAGIIDPTKVSLWKLRVGLAVAATVATSHDSRSGIPCRLFAQRFSMLRASRP